MQAYLTTSLVGERRGEIFRDIFIRDADGKILVDGPEGKPVLDIQHPIQKVVVRSRFAAADGLSVTYQLANGEKLTLEHGYQGPGLDASAVELGEDERLVGVFGRTGFHPWYRGNVILGLGFVVFDAAKGTTRVVNPIQKLDTAEQTEAQNAFPEGTKFYVSDVIAFGGFETGGGIPGLFFYKNAGAQ
ncbi:hypothetical protein C8Q73DRAFT_521162 [Cubamyces lactineus]|nr:hypothetical protein C8Q73DRAFT_521162 [Cubamyces lactineus]